MDLTNSCFSPRPLPLVAECSFSRLGEEFKCNEYILISLLSASVGDEERFAIACRLFMLQSLCLAPGSSAAWMSPADCTASLSSSDMLPTITGNTQQKAKHTTMCFWAAQSLLCPCSVFSPKSISQRPYFDPFCHRNRDLHSIPFSFLKKQMFDIFCPVSLQHIIAAFFDNNSIIC